MVGTPITEQPAYALIFAKSSQFADIISTIVLCCYFDWFCLRGSQVVGVYLGCAFPKNVKCPLAAKLDWGVKIY